MVKLKVKNSGIVTLQSFDDFPDGKLVIGESGKTIPIDIKRFYVIQNLFNKKSVRGKHAHKKLKQYIFCVNGHFTLELDDGKTKQSLKMSDPAIGICLGPMLWHTMKNFSPDCVILVVADDHYDEKDYIRNYADFLKACKTALKK